MYKQFNIEHDSSNIPTTHSRLATMVKNKGPVH